MARRMRRRKCRHCGELFVPDARNTGRQKYCSLPQCRKASKTASQKRWLQKPDNRNYFRGPENVRRVQEWRKAHPGYWRRKPENTGRALQDSLDGQVSENTEDTSSLTHDALQDSFLLQPAVFIGLMSLLTGHALQDDIAMAARRLRELGNDILNTHHKGGRHGTQTPPIPQNHPHSSKAVQLGGSPPCA